MRKEILDAWKWWKRRHGMTEIDGGFVQNSTSRQDKKNKKKNNNKW